MVNADRTTSKTLTSAGWFDIQINGLDGVDFNRAGVTPPEFEKAVRANWRAGVTRFLPTVITGLEDHLSACLRSIDEAVTASELVSDAVPGIHLEGPFISPEDGARGAHPLKAVRPPDLAMFDRLQAAAGGRITLVTVAPEHPGSVEFIRELSSRGIRIALGHTLATTEQISAAVDAGATLSTHLGNGIPASINRHHNQIWDQLADERLTASAIFDGHHLPPNLMRVVHKVKGEGLLVLVSDAVSLAGMPPGRYTEHVGGAVELHPNGRLTQADSNYLAGSASLLLAGVNTALAVLDIEPYAVFELVTRAPERAMGLEPRDDRLKLRLEVSEAQSPNPSSRHEPSTGVREEDPHPLNPSSRQTPSTGVRENTPETRRTNAYSTRHLTIEEVWVKGTLVHANGEDLR